MKSGLVQLAIVGTVLSLFPLAHAQTSLLLDCRPPLPSPPPKDPVVSIAVSLQGTEWRVTHITASGLRIDRTSQYGVHDTSNYSGLSWGGTHLKKTFLKMFGRIAQNPGGFTYSETLYDAHRNDAVVMTSVVACVSLSPNENPSPAAPIAEPPANPQVSTPPIIQADNAKLSAPLPMSVETRTNDATPQETQAQPPPNVENEQAKSSNQDFQAILLILLAVYFLPAIIASVRGHFSFGSILAVNTFLGWTVLGWLMAFAWSLSGNTKANENRLLKKLARATAQERDRTE